MSKIPTHKKNESGTIRAFGFLSGSDQLMQMRLAGIARSLGGGQPEEKLAGRPSYFYHLPSALLFC